MFLVLTALILGYLMGSFPTAYVVTKIRKGIDIREVDVHNVGAAAVIRQVGRMEGLIVAAVDIGKGAGAVIVAQALGLSEPWVLVTGFAALLGHCFPIYIGFRGGQGTATIMGIFFVLSPMVMVIILGLMAIALLLTRRVIFMICLVAPFLPLLLWLLDKSISMTIYSLVIVTFVAFRNRHNVKELRSLRFRWKLK
jgi:glycerol-3-phosphate acyltransferase PlsY